MALVARSRIVGGKPMPKAFPAFMLTINSKQVGCRTRISPWLGALKDLVHKGGLLQRKLQHISTVGHQACVINKLVVKLVVEIHHGKTLRDRGAASPPGRQASSKGFARRWMNSFVSPYTPSRPISLERRRKISP